MYKSRLAKWYTTTVAVLMLAAVGTTANAVEVDKALPDYQKVQGVAGTLNSIGSDTLNNMMTFWVEGFRKIYPNVNVQVEGKGSSTAPPALTEGTSQLGPMSRAMKKQELEAFEARHGFKPTAIGVSLDALAVFVNKDNPLESLTMTEVDSIFSKTQKRGGDDVSLWGEVGMGGKWSKLPISLYGRNSASGTYGFFKKNALKKGDFKDIVKEQPGNASVVLGVSEDRAGIGYSGMGYVTSGVKALALAKKEGRKAYAANYKNVLSGKYPLGRMLYVYVAKEPNKPLETLTKEFLKYMLSKQGQEVVVKDGFLPLPAGAASKQRELLD
ncbi:MAG: phosphate-binding protein [Desulfuromonas sp.]|nr:MAG: phosphate-binding protein [Desulfuromonas sp.]